MGGKLKLRKEGICVYVWLIHFSLQWKLTQLSSYVAVLVAV